MGRDHVPVSELTPMDPNRTALALDGYGIGVSTVRKAPYFAQDLAALCAT
jgi:hypothetical protein